MVKTNDFKYVSLLYGNINGLSSSASEEIFYLYFVRAVF